MLEQGEAKYLHRSNTKMHFEKFVDVVAKMFNEREGKGWQDRKGITVSADGALEAGGGGPALSFGPSPQKADADQAAK